jgi:hypothetical protein
MKVLFSILILFFASEMLVSQNMIWLINGKKLFTNDYRIDQNEKNIWYKNQKGKIKMLETEDIFSLTDSAGNEKVYYTPQSDELGYTVEQMRFFIQGEFDGHLNYQNSRHFTSGMIIGAGSAVCLPLMGISAVLTPILPASYATIIGLKKVNPSSLKIPDQYLQNEFYTDGYKIAASEKRLKKTLLGAGIGWGVGFALIFGFTYK